MTDEIDDKTLKEFIMQHDGKIKALKEVHHPFIAKYTEEFFSDNRKYCVVNEFISGLNLSEIFSQNISLTENEIMNYFTMILLALD